MTAKSLDLSIALILSCEEYEPLDTRLAEKVRQLEAQKESLIEKVADQRRTAPQQAAEQYRRAFLAETEEVDLRYAQELESMDKMTVPELDLGEFKRWDEVQATWARGAEGLLELKGGLTETAAKLERAKSVADMMESKR